MGRVEKRVDLVGTGMHTNPETIEALEEEEKRKARANAPKPKRPFKKVIRDKELERQESQKQEE